jgi:S-DNA-T family DNA segregation ATPase FtsK/SpoIIIE
MNSTNQKEIFNDLLQKFRIKATCIEHKSSGLTSVYKVVIMPPYTFSAFKRMLIDLSFFLKEGKPEVDVVDGIIYVTYYKDTPDILHFPNKDISGEIPIHLGVSNTGKDICFDLAAAPHVLIAGASGTGKTNLLKLFMTNILKNKHTIILVDTKNIDYKSFKHQHHLSKNYQEAIISLNFLIRLMNKRYANLAENKQTGIVYPYVLIIDEYADLIKDDHSNTIKNLLLQLVQKSRAAKIHVVLATQRPSAQIISGDIKANFPIAISCQTSSAIDSRIILGSSGAETLKFKGEAMIKQGSQLEKFQSFYIQ